MMSRAGLVSVVLMALVLACIAKEDDQRCTPSSCGNMHNISYPFRLKGDPRKCGDRRYELACENNRTTLYLSAGKVYVQEIFYDHGTMRVVDASVDNDSCSIPHYSWTHGDFRCPYRLKYSTYSGVFVNCTIEVNSPLYVDFTPCINNSSSPKTNIYALYGFINISDIHEQCTIQSVVPDPSSDSDKWSTANWSISDIRREMLMGFDLSWYPSYEEYCAYKVPFKERFQQFLGGLRFQNFLLDLCYALFFIPWYRSKGYAWYSRTSQIVSYIIKGYFTGRASLGILCFIAFLIYKFKRRHLSADDTIEDFLQSHNNFMPIKYSYLQIKEITKGFADKLGQGGFGALYKGKLRSGHLVEVKVLSMSKAAKCFVQTINVLIINIINLTINCNNLNVYI